MVIYININVSSGWQLLFNVLYKHIDIYMAW